jgi:hypothetical protein
MSEAEMDDHSSSTDLVLLCFAKTEFDCDQYLLALCERRLENARLKRRAKREERDKLEKLVADGEELSVEDRARLELLQSAKKRKNETQRLKRHARREKHDTLEKSVEDGVKLAPEEQTRLDVHQSAREKVNETQRLKRHVKRQKRQEEATNQEHP